MTSWSQGELGIVRGSHVGFSFFRRDPFKRYHQREPLSRNELLLIVMKYKGDVMTAIYYLIQQLHILLLLFSTS